MTKSQRGKSNNRYDYDEENKSHHFKLQKGIQNKKLMRSLDKQLRSRDYGKLLKLEEY